MEETHTVRDHMMQYAQARYGTAPEFLWKKYPGYGVLRHEESRKWYGIFMDVPREKLGLAGTGTVDVLDLKCDPILVGALCTRPGFLPAYHMNKERWVTVLLDGSVPAEELETLLDVSHQLTSKKR